MYSLGGGTFLGLTMMLTGCSTYEEAVELAKDGDHKRVDKLIRDIYGGDYCKFNLPADVVACSFGQLCTVEGRNRATREDLARSMMLMISNNIGSIASMVARSEVFYTTCIAYLFTSTCIN